jgi:hypothetical protein
MGGAAGAPPAREPLTASWRGGYQRYVRTLKLTISPRDLTVCQRKFHLLQMTYAVAELLEDLLSQPH